TATCAPGNRARTSTSAMNAAGTSASTSPSGRLPPNAAAIAAAMTIAVYSGATRTFASTVHGASTPNAATWTGSTASAAPVAVAATLTRAARPGEESAGHLPRVASRRAGASVVMPAVAVALNWNDTSRTSAGLSTSISPAAYVRNAQPGVRLPVTPA